MSKAQSRIAKLSQMFEQKKDNNVPNLEELKARRRNPSVGKSTKEETLSATAGNVNEHGDISQTISLDDYDDDLEYEEEVVFEKK